MSCCLIVRRRNEFVFAVDSAEVLINRYDGIVKRSHKQSKDKLRKFGKDVVFIAGFGQAIQEIPMIVESCIDDNDQHINIKKLHTILTRKYPASKNILKDHNFFEYGVTIFRFENGIAMMYDIAQIHEDEIQEFEPIQKDNTYVGVSGIKTEEIHKDAMKQINTTGKLDVVAVFQNNYCEEVGNEILIYSFKNDILKLEESHKLEEKNLLYGDDELGECDKAHISGSSIVGSTIKGNKIEGCEIKGATIEGSTLRGNEVYIKDKLYIYDSTEDINGNIGGDFEALKIVSEAWTSGNTSYHLYLGDENLEDVTIQTQLVVSVLNGGDPVTSRSTPDQLDWNNSAIWTSYGNFRTGGTHNLASVDYVQNYFARQSEIDSLERRISALESAIASQNS